MFNNEGVVVCYPTGSEDVEPFMEIDEDIGYEQHQ
jgi:hypothetical protein